MATDPKKRQKKLEKQKAKRKAKHHHLVKEKNVGMAQRLTRAATAPVLDAMHTEGLFDQGMGQVLVSRQLPDGTVAVGMFLVDMYCLGVKDAFGRIISRHEYDTRFRTPGPAGRMVPMEPAAARKLVEGAAAYAHDIGFHPHPDYQTARVIFGDIDANHCNDEFEYGDQGKPHFIAGPNDGPARSRQVAATLDHTVGRGNYHVTIPMAGPGMDDLLDAE
jgi:hypothetical protein